MKFKNGKFYKHHAGRAIAIVGIVKTYKWGECFVVEETDPSGHGISCMGSDAEDTKDLWVEIGEEEWDREFKKDYTCYHCGVQIKPGQSYRATPKGFIHESCLNTIARDGIR